MAFSVARAPRIDRCEQRQTCEPISEATFAKIGLRCAAMCRRREENRSNGVFNIHAEDVRCESQGLWDAGASVSGRWKDASALCTSIKYILCKEHEIYNATTHSRRCGKTTPRPYEFLKHKSSHFRCCANFAAFIEIWATLAKWHSSFELFPGNSPSTSSSEMAIDKWRNWIQYCIL